MQAFKMKAYGMEFRSLRIWHAQDLVWANWALGIEVVLLQSSGTCIDSSYRIVLTRNSLDPMWRSNPPNLFSFSSLLTKSYQGNCSVSLPKVFKLLILGPLLQEKPETIPTNRALKYFVLKKNRFLRGCLSSTLSNGLFSSST